MARLVGSRFGLMVSKNLRLESHVSFTKNTAVIKLVSKDDFEEMEHEFLIRTFCPEKLDYLLRCSVAPRNFRWNEAISRVPFTFQPSFPDFFGNGKKPKMLSAHVFSCFLASILFAPTYGLKGAFSISVFPSVISDIYLFYKPIMIFCLLYVQISHMYTSVFISTPGSGLAILKAIGFFFLHDLITWPTVGKHENSSLLKTLVRTSWKSILKLGSLRIFSRISQKQRL